MRLFEAVLIYPVSSERAANRLIALVISFQRTLGVVFLQRLLSLGRPGRQRCASHIPEEETLSALAHRETGRFSPMKAEIYRNFKVLSPNLPPSIFDEEKA